MCKAVLFPLPPLPPPSIRTTGKFAIHFRRRGKRQRVVVVWRRIFRRAPKRIFRKDPKDRIPRLRRKRGGNVIRVALLSRLKRRWMNIRYAVHPIYGMYRRYRIYRTSRKAFKSEKALDQHQGYGQLQVLPCATQVLIEA